MKDKNKFFNTSPGRINVIFYVFYDVIVSNQNWIFTIVTLWHWSFQNLDLSKLSLHLHIGKHQYYPVRQQKCLIMFFTAFLTLFMGKYSPA